jgi:hypothetical protein
VNKATFRLKTVKSAHDGRNMALDEGIPREVRFQSISRAHDRKAGSFCSCARQNPQSQSRLNRREVLKLGAATAAIPLLGGLVAPAQIPAAARTTAEWRQYAGDNTSTKYSPLNQINAENFNRLKIAWTWRSAEEAVVKAI